MLRFSPYVKKFTPDQLETYVMHFLEHGNERKRKKALKIIHARMSGKSRFLPVSSRKVLKLNPMYL